ncbi:MAG: deoxyribonuclease IV [Candidatus Micrarchaeaceae archaeon]
MIKIGFHVSIAGGVSNAPKFAAAHGYTAFQFFPSSSRAWAMKPISQVESREFSNTVASQHLQPFAHIPYLCNPASPSTAVLAKSRNMLAEEIRVCSYLGVDSLVIHLGSHKGEGVRKGMENIVDTIVFSLDKSDKTGKAGVRLLLENSSGYSNSMGSTFSEIGDIFDEVSDKRLGICLDTCHAFSAGYDFKSAEDIERLAEEIDSFIGLKRLGLVHLNDAKYALGSGLDRHWHIGKGRIGTRGFVNFFKNRAFSSGSFILETPYEREGDDYRNLRATLHIMRLAGIKFRLPNLS